MSATTAVLPDARRRPRVALLLALLGLPGSTIAWDLPAGGYWIGMPLAVAAIVIAVTAWSDTDTRGRRLAVVAIVIASIEILFTASWALAG